MINFEDKLSEISTLRETKSSETETLNKINEIWEQVELEQDFATLAKLYWEKAFVYQHLVMNDVDNESNLKLMEESALAAHDLVVSNNLTDLFGDDFRFLGRINDYKGDYTGAFDYYQQALEFYQFKNDPRVLEINAFICANLICQNKVEDGLTLAKKTYTEFDNNPLKQSDFYTWAVWKTGIYPRVVKALISQNKTFDSFEMKNILQNDQKLLTDSDQNFQFRLNEISEALQLL